MLIGLFFYSIALPSLAQRQLSPAQQALVAKDYPAYLAAAPGELDGVMERPQAAFEAMLPAVIALDKTAGWDGETGKGIAALFAASPDAARWWAACKLLVRGDANGLTKLFDGPPPSPYALTTGARLAREHGFTLAADCLTAVSPDKPGLRVKAWLRGRKATIVCSYGLRQIGVLPYTSAKVEKILSTNIIFGYFAITSGNCPALSSLTSVQR